MAADSSSPPSEAPNTTGALPVQPGAANAESPARPTGPRQGTPAWLSLSAWFVFVLVCVAGLSCDLMTKSAAFEHVADEPVQISREDMVRNSGLQPPMHQPVQVIPKVLNLRLVMNPGAVFGIGPGQRWFFVIFTVLAISVGFCLFAFRTRAGDHLAHVAIACVLAGATGNLYDRVFLGAVRDFLNLFPGIPLPFGWHWPGSNPELFPWVFNVADMLLLIGIGLLMIRLNQSQRQQDGTATAADTPAG